MPQRRRRAHGLPRHARRARDLRLGVATAFLATGLAATPVGAAEPTDLDALARTVVGVFDDAFCLLVPHRPLAGIFDPDSEQAAALARRFEAPLRRASRFSVVTLAPSHPFDASQMRVIEPIFCAS